MIVAIDGPAGAGKSTVSAQVAQALGFQLIDTGAMYRCVGLCALRAGVALDDGEALARLAADLDVAFRFEDGRNHVLLGDEDVSADIRTEEVSDAASRVSSLPPVRAALLELQRSLGRRTDAVMEGRDIGTVVFPDAALKVFLTASIDERARRRASDYRDRGEEVDLAQIREDISARDARDSGREVAPLKEADDAVRVDTTSMSQPEVVAHIVELARSRRG